jgi:hypothetical protein
MQVATVRRSNRIRVRSVTRKAGVHKVPKCVLVRTAHKGAHARQHVQAGPQTRVRSAERPQVRIGRADEQGMFSRFIRSRPSQWGQRVGVFQCRVGDTAKGGEQQHVRLSHRACWWSEIGTCGGSSRACGWEAGLRHLNIIASGKASLMLCSGTSTRPAGRPVQPGLLAHGPRHVHPTLPVAGAGPPSQPGPGCCICTLAA